MQPYNRWASQIGLQSSWVKTLETGLLKCKDKKSILQNYRKKLEEEQESKTSTSNIKKSASKGSKTSTSNAKKPASKAYSSSKSTQKTQNNQSRKLKKKKKNSQEDMDDFEKQGKC